MDNLSHLIKARELFSAGTTRRPENDDHLECGTEDWRVGRAFQGAGQNPYEPLRSEFQETNPKILTTLAENRNC